MKLILKKIALVVASCMMTMIAYAQEPSTIGTKIDELVQKYEKTKGVEAVTINKGLGLNIVKKMLNKQFGKEFMKGVTSFTIIEYSKASDQTIQDLRQDFEALAPLVDEIEVGDTKEFANNEYIRCFASPIDSITATNFVVASENKDGKMIIHMSGKIQLK